MEIDNKFIELYILFSFVFSKASLGFFFTLFYDELLDYSMLLKARLIGINWADAKSIPQAYISRTNLGAIPQNLLFFFFLDKPRNKRG